MTTAALRSGSRTDAALTHAFTRDGYVVVPSLLDGQVVGFLWAYVQARARSGVLGPDIQVPGAASAYADPALEALLDWLRPTVEAVAGRELEPTYSYYRVYRCGDTLAPHRDRPACEVSASISLGASPPVPWPLAIRGTHGVAKVLLAPGDALLYRGTECEHWREAYQGDSLGQTFLHYVDRHGPHKDWKFDRRGSLRFFY